MLTVAADHLDLSIYPLCSGTREPANVTNLSTKNLVAVDWPSAALGKRSCVVIRLDGLFETQTPLTNDEAIEMNPPPYNECSDET